jgi:hypothetical protein
MTTIKVSELPVVTTPYDGSEYTLGIQNGMSVKVPVLNLAAATGASLIGTTPSGTLAASTVAASLTELDTEKASTAALTSGLALKADTTTVNSQLALKADTTTVNSQLTLKADTTTVNSQLALKADTTTISASTGSTLVGTTNGGTGAVARTVASKINDLASVKDFGAVGDGVTDDTSSFSLAATNTPANVTLPPLYSTNIARSPINKVYIPAGSYNIASLVSTGLNTTYWILDHAAVINNPDNLNGVVNREGEQTSDFHYGTMNYATTAIFTSNSGLNAPAQVTGLVNPSDLAAYSGRDSVGIYSENVAPPLKATIVSATYTATTIIPSIALTSDQIKKLRIGMIIDTQHATKYSGFITSWASNGSSITVSNWYLSGGAGTPATPANGIGAYVNPFTKIWGYNTNVALNSSSFATASTGFELGLLDNKGPSNVTWGFDSVNLGTYRGTAAFIARGDWATAYKTVASTGIGFWYQGTGSAIVAHDASNQPFFSVSNTGNTELGSQTVSQVTYIDVHSSGTTADYDVRISCVGGSSTAGGGALTLTGALISINGAFRPISDNTIPLGSASLRWSVVYAATGTINTSDGRLKTEVESLDAAELATAKALKGLIKKFKYTDSVAEKGTAARIHVGVIAQEVEAAFIANGLDATQYGIFCYDEWEEILEVKCDKGLVVIPYSPAGNRYGIRYEQLLAFIIAAL